MDLNSIPFILGMQYENWEFDLEVLPDRIKGYDSYLYVGEVKKFLNLISDKTELIFCWDRLEVVILDFDNKSLNYYEKLNRPLQLKSPNYTTEINSDFIIQKFTSEKVIYWTIYFISTKEIKVIYFSNEYPFIDKILE